MRSIDDRSTAAKIRDAAIECFAEAGFASTSIRTIAAHAEVSPALVIHHFRSKEELRVACDQFITAKIRTVKSDAMAAGAAFDPLAAFRQQNEGPPVLLYLARTLADGSAHVAELVDEMVADAAGYMKTGVETGMITPSDFHYQRAAILTIWTLGGLVLHEHMERLLGVDITAELSDPKAASNYIGPVLELAGGFITKTTRELMAEAFVAAPEKQETDSQ